MVSNTGNLDLAVVVDDTLKGVLFNDVLPAGESRTFGYGYIVLESDPDPLVNTVTATGSHDTLAEDIVRTASASVDLVNPEIKITKTADKPLAEVDDEVVYTITVENTGDHPLENIVVLDDLLGGDITAEFNFSEPLEPGESETATFDYTIDSDDVVDGKVSNTVTVTSNPVGLTNVIDDDAYAVVIIDDNGKACFTETAWGGNTEGPGPAWWYYYDTTITETVQVIIAGQIYIAGTVEFEDKNGEWDFTITFNPGWDLEDVDESVKIQGYAENALPSFRPAPGGFESYKGAETTDTFDDDGYVYFAIHLDAEFCGDTIDLVPYPPE